MYCFVPWGQYTVPRGIIRNLSGFCPGFLAGTFNNPWNFLSDSECLSYTSGENLGGPLDSFRMGDGHQKAQAYSVP